MVDMASGPKNAVKWPLRLLKFLCWPWIWLFLSVRLKLKRIETGFWKNAVSVIITAVITTIVLGPPFEYAGARLWNLIIDSDSGHEIEIRNITERGLKEANDAFCGGATDGAEEKYKELIKNNPHNSSVQFALGCLYYKQGNYYSAAPQFKEAVKVDESNTQALLLLTHSLLKIGSTIRALEFAKQAAARDSGDEVLQFELALAYYYNDSLPAAESQLEFVRHIAPTYPGIQWLEAELIKANAAKAGP